MQQQDDPYGCDNDITHLIPSFAISGRIPGNVKAVLVGKVDIENGTIRIDAVNMPEFYIELKLAHVPALSYAPGASGALAAQADFEAAAEAAASSN